MNESDPLTKNVVERYEQRQTDRAKRREQEAKQAQIKQSPEHATLKRIGAEVEDLAALVEKRWGQPRRPMNRLRRLIGREAVKPVMLQQAAVDHIDGSLVSQSGQLAIRMKTEPYKAEKVQGVSVESSYVYQVWPFKRVKGNRDSFHHDHSLSFGVFDHRRIPGERGFAERPLYTVNNFRMLDDDTTITSYVDGRERIDYETLTDEAAQSVEFHLQQAINMLEYTKRDRYLLTAHSA